MEEAIINKIFELVEKGEFDDEEKQKIFWSGLMKIDDDVVNKRYKKNDTIICDESPILVDNSACNSNVEVDDKNVCCSSDNDGNDNLNVRNIKERNKHKSSNRAHCVMDIDKLVAPVMTRCQSAPASSSR